MSLPRRRVPSRARVFSVDQSRSFLCQTEPVLARIGPADNEMSGSAGLESPASVIMRGKNIGRGVAATAGPLMNK